MFRHVYILVFFFRKKEINKYKQNHLSVHSDCDREKCVCLCFHFKIIIGTLLERYHILINIYLIKNLKTVRIEGHFFNYDD